MSARYKSQLRHGMLRARIGFVLLVLLAGAPAAFMSRPLDRTALDLKKRLHEAVKGERMIMLPAD